MTLQTINYTDNEPAVSPELPVILLKVKPKSQNVYCQAGGKCKKLLGNLEKVCSVCSDKNSCNVLTTSFIIPENIVLKM